MLKKSSQNNSIKNGKQVLQETIGAKPAVDGHFDWTNGHTYGWTASHLKNYGKKKFFQTEK